MVGLGPSLRPRPRTQPPGTDGAACHPPRRPPPVSPARCLDQYFDLRRREVEGGEEGLDVDPRLVAVVERMIAAATAAGQWEQAVGVALEARRLDLLESVVGRAPDQGAVLSYALRVTQRLVVNRNFRHQVGGPRVGVRARGTPRRPRPGQKGCAVGSPSIASTWLSAFPARGSSRHSANATQPPTPQVLRLLVRLAEAAPSPDWVEVCQCLMFLDDAPRVADILARLIDGREDDALVAYQVGGRGNTAWVRPLRPPARRGGGVDAEPVFAPPRSPLNRALLVTCRPQQCPAPLPPAPTPPLTRPPLTWLRMRCSPS